MQHIKYFVKVDSHGFIRNVELQEVDDPKLFNFEGRQEIPEIAYALLSDQLEDGASFRIVGGDIVKIEDISRSLGMYKLKIERKLDNLRKAGVSVQLNGRYVTFNLDSTSIESVNLYNGCSGSFHMTDILDNSIYVSGEDTYLIKAAFAHKFSFLSELRCRFLTSMSEAKTLHDMESIFKSFLTTVEVHDADKWRS